jgi:hypothetical protein
MAFPCANPQTAEAIAMAKPELITTHWACESDAGAALPCAKIIGLAIVMRASSRKIFLVIRCLLKKSLQEVVPGHLTAGLTLQSG